MNKGVKWIFGLLILTILLPLLILKISEWHFGSNRYQASILMGYYPAAQCGKAKFKALEVIDIWQDYSYLYEISGSRECFESLKKSVVRIEPMPGDLIAKDADALEDYGWYDMPQKDPFDELVGLKFESDGQTILWKRVQI